ncbi:right-handed parallel beta-helix repeat-containing protein [Dyadobacter sp. CY356]|uniref:right-handed parallel beta-helix repeat-containing protein n=1 Tax=Dyadobacter sp. CY356 TaxID=2906442 RepID=UPI001F2F8706|nr:right-handed parallel beta-helix repeat-containing protein [Dyadobacter sp. CY356]MCF0058144.1 right-handed parallel beta-helix repeat-containing protein [Dyadobacter sp. CY356]
MKSNFINVFILKTTSPYSDNHFRFSKNLTIPFTLFQKFFTLLFILLFSSLFNKISAQCSVSQDFSTAINTSETQAANSWYVDRYAPSGFSSPSADLSGGILKHVISTADGALNRPANFQTPFYNTQGRKYDFPFIGKVMRVKLYIPSDWSSLGQKRWAGLWGTAVDATNVPVGFPILEFTTEGIPRFRGYNDDNNAWLDMGLPSDFAYNSWVTLEIKSLPSGEFLYTVGNKTATTTAYAAHSAIGLGGGILQGYNYPPGSPNDAANSGFSYNIYWDDFSAQAGDGLVTNSTKGLNYCSIQDAVNAADPGNVINVSAAIFNEEVTINKSLIINGANVGVAGNGTRGTESIIDGNSGARSGFVVLANNVTIDGFTIRGAAGIYNSGVYSSPTTSGLTLQNNFITDNRIGAYPSSNGASVVKNNLFNANNRTGSAGGAGIYVEATNALTIEGNEFTGHNINSAAVFAALTPNAHQNLVFTKNYIHDNNNDNSMVYLTNVNNANISYNTIIQSGTTAIKVAGGNNNVIITNNLLNGNTTAIKIQNDGTGANVGTQAHENSLVSTKSIDNSDIATVNASCNWYGSSLPSGVTAKISGPVSYVPFTNSGTDSNGADVGFVPAPNTCIYLVHNVTHPKDFGTIQEAISDPGTLANDVIKIDAGTFPEILTIDKSLTFEGANKDVCGTATRFTETILIAPASGILLGLNGAVSIVINGVKIDGNGVANITQPNQNLTIKNSVLELDFVSNQNNIYFGSNTLVLECNSLQAIAGVNANGNSSHIFFAGSALTANNNKITSEAARSSMSSVTNTNSLPVWINITTNANNVNVNHNEFTKIDIGILLASNAGNVKIENNEFKEANREILPNGSGMGAGIAIFENLSPTGPISINNNKFLNSETGIRTSGSGTSFPASNLLSIRYNSFESMSDKAIRINNSYVNSASRLNALCNWFGNITGPSLVTTNPGGGGTQILDGNDKVSYKNWLFYGTDADNAQLGFQLPTTLTVSPGNNVSVAENHYRILSNAIGCVTSNQTLTLSGTFDYTNVIAKDEWVKGNDGVSQGTTSAFAAGSGDDYAILAPSGTENVVITAASLGSAIIKGPEDLGNVSLEAFIFFNSNTPTSTFNAWTLSNLTINNFDASIAADNNNGTVTAMNNFKVMNNEILIPKDLNQTSEAVNFQNIGIHLNFGKNQEIKGNKIVMDGAGVSDGTTSYSNSVALQSATSGGDIYDGLKIQNNEIHVTGTPNAAPARIIGIWENSNNQTANIDISGNKFINDDASNLAENNNQLAFRVTSFSGGSTQVVYQNNEISGFNRGIDWIGDPFSQYNANPYAEAAKPVIIKNNKIDKVKFGITVRKDPASLNGGSPAEITNNSFTNIPNGGYAIGNTSTGTTLATCNWYDNPLTVNVISATNGGSVTYLPKLSNGNDASSSAGFQLDGANNCQLPVYNITQAHDYLTIQDAVNAANAGDEIRVGTGIYPENVIVNKSVRIFGVDSTNVIVDKGDANYSSTGGVGFSLQANGIILNTMTVKNFDNGIETGTDISTVTIDAMNLNENFSNGFFGKRTVTDLTIKNSNINSNGYKGGIQSGSGYKRGIMFESQGGSINNLIIDNNNADNNGLVGIDISGLIPINGITINNNRARNNFDSQIGVSLGNNSLSSPPALITENVVVVSKSARFGIEIKNPLGTGSASGNGSIKVWGNKISLASHPGSPRDLAAIAVMRRKDGHAIINDQPQGVQVLNNIITDFQNAGGDAFGIVLGGTGHLVSNNKITNTKYSIQVQKGNTDFGTNNSSPNSSDFYFERDNSADVCVEFGANDIISSGAPRMVTSGTVSTLTLPVVRVTNTNLTTRFCTIQQAIDFMATVNTHVIVPDAGSFPENVIVNKSVKLRGPNYTTAGNGSRVGETVIIPGIDNVTDGALVKIAANDVTLEGLSLDGSNTSFPSAVVINGLQTNAAFGVLASASFTGLTIQNNIIKNLSKHGVDLDAKGTSSNSSLITNNWFDNIPRYNAAGFYGRGVLLANNFYASVVNNTFSRVERGIQTNNFSNAIQSGIWEIKGNVIKAYNIGALLNLHYQSTSDLSFENNNIEKDQTTRTISTGDALPDEDFTGLEVFSISDAVKVLIKGGTIKNAVNGISSWNNSSSNHVIIDGVSFDNNITAVLQSNISRYNDAIDSEIDVKNVTLSDGNAQKAFVAEDLSSTHAVSSINMISNNTITAGNTLQYPFYLKDGSKARIKAGGTQVTLSTQNAVTFSNTGTAATPNLVITAGLVVNLAGHDLRVVSLPEGAIVDITADFTAPDKVVKNPVLINGRIWFTNGILNSGNGSIEFGNTASDIMTGDHPEKATSYILGKALLANRTIGGSSIDMLGVKMGAGPDLGTLIIVRTTTNSGAITPPFPGNASIRTVWEITPSNQSASRGDVQFRYLNNPTNLNAQIPSAIYAYRYNTGISQWEKKSALRSSIATADIYTTETFGVAQFSSWTLSSAEPGPDLTPLIDMSNRNFLAGSLTKPMTIRLFNLTSGTTTEGAMTISISKPSFFTFVLSGGSDSEWELSTIGNDLVVLISKPGVTITSGVEKQILTTVTASASTPNGDGFNFIINVEDGSGSETNNTNNSRSVRILVNK